MKRSNSSCPPSCRFGTLPGLGSRTRSPVVGTRYAPGPVLRGLRRLSSPSVSPSSRDLLHGPSPGRMFYSDGSSARLLVLAGPLHGSPLLVPLEQRVHSLRRLHAQRLRGLDRASRGDPPIWEDVKMHFLRPRSWTCPISLKDPEATSKNFPMNGTG